MWDVLRTREFLHRTSVKRGTRFIWFPAATSVLPTITPKHTWTQNDGTYTRLLMAEHRVSTVWQERKTSLRHREASADGGTDGTAEPWGREKTNHSDCGLSIWRDRRVNQAHDLSSAKQTSTDERGFESWRVTAVRPLKVRQTARITSQMSYMEQLYCSWVKQFKDHSVCHCNPGSLNTFSIKQV